MRSVDAIGRWVARGVACALVLFTVGCRRNPLDLEVQAETPYAFLEWQERVMARQPEGVATEFKQAVARIVAASPTKLSLHNERLLHSRQHPICRELDGCTVREVIIAGYRVANETLLRGMILGSDNLVMALKYEDTIRAATNDGGRLDRMVAQRSAMLGTAKAQVEANRRRIAELERGVRRGREDFFVRFSRWRVLTLIVP